MLRESRKDMLADCRDNRAVIVITYDEVFFDPHAIDIRSPPLFDDYRGEIVAESRYKSYSHEDIFMDLFSS